MRSVVIYNMHIFNIQLSNWSVEIQSAFEGLQNLSMDSIGSGEIV